MHVRKKYCIGRQYYCGKISSFNLTHSFLYYHIGDLEAIIAEGLKPGWRHPHTTQELDQSNECPFCTQGRHEFM